MYTLKDIDIAIVKHFRAIGKCKTIEEFNKLSPQRQNISICMFKIGELEKEQEFFNEWIELYRNFKEER